MMLFRCVAFFLFFHSAYASNASSLHDSKNGASPSSLTAAAPANFNDPYDVTINMAREKMVADDPEAALVLYDKALQIAQTPEDRRVALFGIGDAQLWLEKYGESEKIFRSLINNKLDADDYEAALDGLVRSLNYQGKAKEAYALVPPNFVFTDPSAVIGAAQAALEAGLPEKAETLLNANAKVLAPLDSTSYLTKQLNNLRANIADALTQKGVLAQKTDIQQLPAPTLTSSYERNMEAGEHQFDSDKLQSALVSFKKAEYWAQTDDERQRALFGIGRTQLWLDKYSQSEKTFRTLIRNKLSKNDYEIALDGLVRSVNYQGKSHQAYALIPKNFVYTTPSMVIAGAQAALWAGSPKKAQALLNSHRKILMTVEPKSALAKELAALRKDIISPLHKINPNDEKVDALIRAGNENFDADRPEEALNYYQQAYQLSGNNIENKQAALFGIGQVELSLDHNKMAEPIYHNLLHSNLNQGDYEVALNGYVRSVSALDRPKAAYRSIPPNFNYTMATMVIGAAKSALWSGWAYKAQTLLDKYHVLLSQVDRNSYLGRELTDLEWQVNAEAAKNTITPSFFGESDSDGFSARHYRIAYAHRFTPTSNTSVYFDRASYDGISTPDPDADEILPPTQQSLYANSYGIQQEWWATDAIKLEGGIGSGDYAGWQPLFWNASFVYYPNDFWRVTVLNKNELVETFNSFANRVTVNTSELDLTLFPAYRWVLTGSAYHQRYTDENNQNGFGGDISYLIFANLGLSTEVFAREFSDSNPYTGNYFNPNTYRQGAINLKLDRRLFFSNTWRWYAIGGLGEQKVDDDAYTPTHSYEFGLIGPITKHFVLDAFYGYSDVAGGSDTGFARRYGGIRGQILF